MTTALATLTGKLAQFLAERMTGLGGSDIGAILGLSPYKTPLDVWMEKTGQVAPQESSLQMRFGAMAEQFVADEYEATTGRKTQRFNPMLRHPSAPLIGHVDRLIIPDGAKVASHKQEIRTDRLLECKTANAFALNSGEWGDSGTDLVPATYLVQCATYMALTGCETADLACLFGNHDFRVYTIARDRELEAALVEQATIWWQRHIIEGAMPDPRTAEEAKRVWPAHIAGKRVIVDVTVADAIRRRADMKKQIGDIEKQIGEIENVILPAIADGDEVVCNGAVVATYRANKASPRTDWASAADQIKGWMIEHNIEGGVDAVRDCIDSSTTMKPGARVLRIAKSKE